jgi:hypothetical protein
LIQPTQTIRARPRANATAQASSEMPKPAAFAATLVVSFFSGTIVDRTQAQAVRRVTTRRVTTDLVGTAHHPGIIPTGRVRVKSAFCQADM